MKKETKLSQELQRMNAELHKADLPAEIIKDFSDKLTQKSQHLSDEKLKSLSDLYIYACKKLYTPASL